MHETPRPWYYFSIWVLLITFLKTPIHVESLGCIEMNSFRRVTSQIVPVGQRFCDETFLKNDTLQGSECLCLIFILFIPRSLYLGSSQPLWVGHDHLRCIQSSSSQQCRTMFTMDFIHFQEDTTVPNQHAVPPNSKLTPRKGRIHVTFFWVWTNRQSVNFWWSWKERQFDVLFLSEIPDWCRNNERTLLSDTTFKVGITANDSVAKIMYV